MADRPILFSAPMVKALLAGTKTQTRRRIKAVVPHDGLPSETQEDMDVRGWIRYGGDWLPPCPYGDAGSRLWVRETWAPYDSQTIATREKLGIFYRADDETKHSTDGAWKSPIHMPRWASRITLEITAVRVERLQDISAKDILAEGAVLRAHDDQFGHNPVSAFDGKCYMDLKSLWSAGWQSINGAGSWAANPWVWCLSFHRIQPPKEE